ncbi:hypothetical protein EYV94_24400 [Puteibacter caeruleilacunae]|nr:hypothetical protein EYV94_24400 [Puteibacter caeruleilacunae]
MNRREFVVKSGLLMSLLPLMKYANATTVEGLKFGLVTDLHYADREINKTRHYRDSIAKLQDAVKEFNQQDVDFVINLGDLKDESKDPSRKETLQFLNTIEKVLQKFNGPIYHVLGNHDMDSITKKDYLKTTKNSGKAKGKSYYAFQMKGIRFVVLDANYNSEMQDYEPGNFKWNDANIPEEQLKWLEKELSDSDLPTVVFIHQLLDDFAMKDDHDLLHCVKNAAEVRTIMEKAGNVIAVFQGHDHAGNYSYNAETHFFTMKAMVEGAYPENNCYAVVEIKGGEIHIDGFGHGEDRTLFL